METLPLKRVHNFPQGVLTKMLEDKTDCRYVEATYRNEYGEIELYRYDKQTKLKYLID